MQGSGAVTFKNLETNKTFNANLYKTDKAGIYQAVKTSVGEGEDKISARISN